MTDHTCVMFLKSGVIDYRFNFNMSDLLRVYLSGRTDYARTFYIFVTTSQFMCLKTSIIDYKYRFITHFW